MHSSKVLLFNPRAANYKARIPNSILSIAASIDGLFDYTIIDGNLESDPLQKIITALQTNQYAYFASTVMPGPQLKQAIPFTKRIKEQFPQITIIWGGYFASNQSKVCMESGFINYIIYGPGDKAFPQLLNAIKNNLPLELIPNLIWKNNDTIQKNHKDELYDQDTLPAMPYERLNTFYPVEKYLGKTYLGKKTIAYHSSIGCPFKCAFCGIVPIFNARWKGKSAQLIYDDILYLKNKYGGDAIEFHDNNFFVNEKRTVEFADLIAKENMIWWGEGRIDTIDKYSDASLEKMRKAGCKMIFFGAETGNDAILKEMDKGGTQTGAQIKAFAARMQQFDIIPEYSFVLGTPASTEEEVNKRIDEDIAFIRTIKEINPATEIIIYVYSPVPTEGSALFKAVEKSGFHFPQKLEDWISPHWENFDLRKNPLTPWLKPYMIDKIKNFETVLNGFYPTVSDYKMQTAQRKLLRNISAWRYKSKLYNAPYEIKAIQKFIRYRQPELEGF
ncbi:MAG: B12-binding domain-containing radical SAM protein [Bacteroidetes bacterium]|nr:B12-binding domain-containing radical SAM protein [Bacteroidota bacterium]